MYSWRRPSYFEDLAPKSYEIPPVINEELFPVHDRYMDQLRDIVTGKCSTKAEKHRMRQVLKNDCTKYFLKYLENSVVQKRRIVGFFSGGTRLGKSTNAITVNLYGREKFIDYLAFTPEIVYTQSFSEVSQAIKEAERKGSVYLIQQDEDSEVGGSGSKSSLGDYVNCVTNLAYRRDWFLICCPRFNSVLNGLFDFVIRVVGYNENLNNGTSSNVLYYPDGTEQGYVILSKFKFEKNSPFRNEYEFYDIEIKPAHQHEIASTGGAVAASNLSGVMQRARRITQKLIELEPDAEKCTEKLIGAAIVASGEKVLTDGDERASILYNVQKIFAEYQKTKQPVTTPIPQSEKATELERSPVIDRRMDRKAASAYSNRGHEAEPELWHELLPKWLKGAKVVYVGGYGKEDGIIEYNGVTYVCDSKDYSIPLTDKVDYVENRKLKGCLDRYRAEKNRGNNNVTVTILYHEVNRNKWLVHHVKDPLSIPVDSRGRPKKSQKIYLGNTAHIDTVKV